MSTPPTPIFYDKAQVCLVDSGPITAPGLDRVQFAISTIPCVVIAVSRHLLALLKTTTNPFVANVGLRRRCPRIPRRSVADGGLVETCLLAAFVWVLNILAIQPRSRDPPVRGPSSSGPPLRALLPFRD